jgi:hypothetical protein
MLEHLSKFGSLMPSLALIFHLVEVADWVAGLRRGSDPSKNVPLHCVEKAAQCCDYLESHARRIYGLAANAALQAARKLLDKIKIGEIKDGFSARDVYTRNLSFLDTKELTQAAIDELIETRWIREVPAPPPSKRARPFMNTYQIHPKAIEILKSRTLDEDVV